MTALLGAVCLAILSGINYRVGGSLRYPPALFAAWWALLLMGLACSGDTFLPISPFTLAIYIIGPCAMSLGGLVGLLSWGRKFSGRVARGSWECRSRILTASLVLLTALLPALWARIQQLSAVSGVRDFWVGVRLQTMQADNSLGVFDDLIFFSTIAAWVAFLEQQRLGTGRLRAVIAIILGFLYHLATASRLGALILIGGLVGIAIIHGRNLLRPLLTGAFAVILIFMAVALARNTGTERTDSSMQKVVSLARSFQLYALGGVVAFDSVTAHTVTPDFSGRTYRVLYVVARASGYNVEPPQLMSQYTYTPLPTNVYSIYYPYFADFGPAGVGVLFAVLGLFFTLIYLGARQGEWPLMIGYGMIFSYIVLSSADEYVFSLVSMNIKAAIFVALLYKYSRSSSHRCVPLLMSSS
jgi:oligosaccharide repeat unit polymerase